MNRIGGNGTGNAALVLWLACIVVVCAGYYLTFDVFAQAIGVQRTLTAPLSAAILADAETVAQRPALERERLVIDERLRGLDLRVDRAATVARFVQTAAHIADHNQVSLDGVEARGAPAPVPVSPATPAPPTGFSFEPIALEITLRGSYDGLLTTIRELAAVPLPMQIEIAALERSAAAPPGAAAGGPLTARLHLVLQHLTAAARAGETPHSNPEDVTTHARPS